MKTKLWPWSQRFNCQLAAVTGHDKAQRSEQKESDSGKNQQQRFLFILGGLAGGVKSGQAGS